MTATTPGLAIGIAAVAPTVTVLIAIVRAVLNTNSRRRKKVLANLDFVSRLRDYEAKDHVTLSPHVFDRAHADLARSARLYVDRESWKWVLAYLLVYGSFINVFATFVSLLIQGMYWALRWQLPQDVLAPLKLSTTVSSVAILAVAAVVCLWFAFEVSWGGISERVRGSRQPPGAAAGSGSRAAGRQAAFDPHERGEKTHGALA